MKTKTLLFFFFLIVSCTLHAQIDKGRIQIGGTVSAGHQKSEANDLNPESKTTNISVSPSLGVFYAKNRMVGFSLDFGYSEYSNLPTINRRYGGGIFLRQYLPVVSKLYILFDEGVNYDYLSGTDYRGSIHGNAFSLHVGTGLAYDIARKMQLELSLNNLAYAGYYKTNRDEFYNVGSSLEGNSFTGITLGFRYYLK